MDNITKLPDPIDIKCSWDDQLFTISQTMSGVSTGITLTNDEAQYLLEQLILWGNRGTARDEP